MPAALPGSTAVQNGDENPSAGLFVIFDLLSGPKGSPFDMDEDGNASTGALSTGIGFGSPPIIGLTAPASIVAAGFNDAYVPGVTKPDGTAATESTLMYIGGGKSDAPTIATDGAALAAPYTAGFGIGGAGQGGSRDAGEAAPFTGFMLQTVTAAAGVAAGGVVETGYVNRSGAALLTGQSVFGSSTTASDAVA